jgi:hypothetical protein
MHLLKWYKMYLKIADSSCRNLGSHSSGYKEFFIMDTFFSGWGETESSWYVGHCWPIVPAPDDRWWWLWSSWWNEDWQGKPKYSEKTCPSVPLCPPQIPHDLTWDRTRAAAVGSQRLTAWAMARPLWILGGKHNVRQTIDWELFQDLYLNILNQHKLMQPEGYCCCHLDNNVIVLAVSNWSTKEHTLSLVAWFIDRKQVYMIVISIPI